MALTFKTAIDEPRRFPNSRDVAAHLGLTPLVRQSGTKRRVGAITRSGDAAARSALYMAALHQVRRFDKQSWLQTWGNGAAARRGRKKATVAIARRLAVALHRMWVTETDFRWTAEGA